MSDPSAVTDALDAAEDAFEYRGHEPPGFEDGIDRGREWKTQLTKACRYLDACRTLRNADGFSGAVVELCFGAIERSLEGYVLRMTDDDLDTYRNHTDVYDRAAELGLFTRRTAADLQALYDANRTEHYYGGLVPTRQKEDAMYTLASETHGYVTDQIREGGVCQCVT